MPKGRDTLPDGRTVFAVLPLRRKSGELRRRDLLGSCMMMACSNEEQPLQDVFGSLQPADVLLQRSVIVLSVNHSGINYDIG